MCKVTTNEHSRASAKIYAFPSRGRAGLGLAGRIPQAGRPAPVAASAFGSAWYHDAAIQEDRAPKR